jgi:hypothetical protein
MKLLWSEWQIVRRDAKDLTKNYQLGKDHILGELQHDLMVTRSIVITGFAIGLIALLVIWRWGDIKEGYAVFFWALACYALGALLGFLFGIPRVIQNQPQPERTLPEVDSSAVGRREGYRLIINTNLDDVSDWLTKIVVGVGLVELEKLPGLIHRLAAEIGGEVGAQHVPFITAVMLYFTTVGFMSGYLTTRMFFQRAFRIADKAASESRGSSTSVERKSVTRSSETVGEIEHT